MFAYRRLQLLTTVIGGGLPFLAALSEHRLKKLSAEAHESIAATALYLKSGMRSPWHIAANEY
jgi:hypothetical protein